MPLKSKMYKTITSDVLPKGYHVLLKWDVIFFSNMKVKMAIVRRLMSRLKQLQ